MKNKQMLTGRCMERTARASMERSVLHGKDIVLVKLINVLLPTVMNVGVNMISQCSNI